MILSWLSVLLITTEGRAAQIPGSQFAIGNWSGAAYTSDANDNFSHCAISSTYNSGISLIFVAGTWGWALHLYNPAWQLQQGQQYSVSYYIDYNQGYQVQATALTENMVELALPDSAEAFNQFRFGNQLTVIAASQNLVFNLTGTSSALYALGACLIARTSPTPSNPFSATNPFALQPTGSGSDERAEATTLVANLLSMSGTTIFHFLTPDQIPSEWKQFQAVWATASTIGVISIDHPVAGVAENEIAGFIIGTDSASCKGKFASGAMPDQTNPGGHVKRIFTSCQGQQTFNVYYLIFPRPRGGYYVIGTANYDNPAQARQTDDDIRSAVYRTFSE
jgi:hypothetical protein